MGHLERWALMVLVTFVAIATVEACSPQIGNWNYNFTDDRYFNNNNNRNSGGSYNRYGYGNIYGNGNGADNNNNNNNRNSGDSYNGYGNNNGNGNEKLQACRHGSITYDNCGRKCRCNRGRLMQCTRARKEFTAMTSTERQRYIRVIRTASRNRRYKRRYDNLIAIHRRYFGTDIHRKDHFLPWHRWYLLEYENMMRQIDCRFTVAYWDWGKDATNPWRQTAQSVWYTRNTGLGGNGSGRDRCVRKGPFRRRRWWLTPSAGRRRCLARRFNGTPPDTVAIVELLKTESSNFHDFELTLRVNFHDQVHCQINGTMCTIDSANAPEFFLHHAMIDKIWMDWQKQSSTHRDAFFRSVTSRMPGCRHLPSFITHYRHPSWVRVEYATSVAQRETVNRFKGMNVTQLKAVTNRPRISPLNTAALRLFRVSRADQNRALKVQARLMPNNINRLPEMPVISRDHDKSKQLSVSSRSDP